MCVTIWRRKISKNSELDCFQVCAIDHKFKKYVHTKLFQHVTYSQRINYSIQNFLFLMFVNHLLFRKQKGRIFLEGEATFSLSQGDEATSSPRFNSPHLQQRFPQHNQQQLQHNHPRGLEDNNY